MDLLASREISSTVPPARRLVLQNGGQLSKKTEDIFVPFPCLQLGETGLPWDEWLPRQHDHFTSILETLSSKGMEEGPTFFCHRQV